MHRRKSVHTVFVAIGSNVGQRIYALSHAVQGLSALGSDLACSAVYETAPVGYTDQADFLNMVVRFTTDLSPLQLLTRLLALESAVGRERTVRFGPRTLDLDILLYDNEYICFRNLQIPHPRMWQRGFVMVPLADLAPNRVAPGGRTVGQIATHLWGEGDIQYVGRFW